MKTTHTVAQQAPATAELCAILRDFCQVRKRLDAFRESDQGDIMRDLSDRYIAADRNIGSALSYLFEYVGIFLQDDFSKNADHE